MADPLYVGMCDGYCAQNPGLARTGWLLWNRRSDYPIARGGRSIGASTSNRAEWQALIDLLQEAVLRDITRLVVYTDSQVVSEQFAHRWRAKNPQLRELRDEAWALSRNIGEVQVIFVYRQILQLADRQARGLS